MPFCGIFYFIRVFAFGTFNFHNPLLSSSASWYASNIHMQYIGFNAFLSYFSRNVDTLLLQEAGLMTQKQSPRNGCNLQGHTWKSPYYHRYTTLIFNPALSASSRRKKLKKEPAGPLPITATLEPLSYLRLCSNVFSTPVAVILSTFFLPQ